MHVPANLTLFQMLGNFTFTKLFTVLKTSIYYSLHLIPNGIHGCKCLAFWFGCSCFPEVKTENGHALCEPM